MSYYRPNTYTSNQPNTQYVSHPHPRPSSLVFLDVLTDELDYSDKQLLPQQSHPSTRSCTTSPKPSRPPTPPNSALRRSP